MIPSLLNATFSTAYATGMSYVLQASALDQKVFNFVAPKLRDACAFGIVYSLTNLVLEASIRTLTDTDFRYESGFYNPGHYEMDSAYPTLYRIFHAIAPLIAAFGSAYLLKQMSYSVSYSFAAVCVTPLVLAKAFRVMHETTTHG